MGLLALGTPLPWEEAKTHSDYVKEHGIEQFLKIWHRLKDRTGDVLLWGDEVSVQVHSWITARALNGKIAISLLLTLGLTQSRLFFALSGRSNTWSSRTTTRERMLDCPSDRLRS